MCFNIKVRRYRIRLHSILRYIDKHDIIIVYALRMQSNAKSLARHKTLFCDNLTWKIKCIGRIYHTRARTTHTHLHTQTHTHTRKRTYTHTRTQPSICTPTDNQIGIINLFRPLESRTRVCVKLVVCTYVLIVRSELNVH